MQRRAEKRREERKRDKERKIKEKRRAEKERERKGEERREGKISGKKDRERGGELKNLPVCRLNLRIHHSMLECKRRCSEYPYELMKLEVLQEELTTYLILLVVSLFFYCHFLLLSYLYSFLI